MPKKKVVEKEPENIICEVAPHLTEGEVLTVEPHDPPRVADVGHKKPRKPLSQDSLDKLAKAREMAYKKRMELKKEREEPKKEVIEEPILEEPKPISQPIIKEKKKKKKPIVVVEQDSSDSEDEQQVVYIKKREKKKIIVQEESIPQQEPVPMYQEPPLTYVVPNPSRPRYGYNIPYNPTQKFSNRRQF